MTKQEGFEKRFIYIGIGSGFGWAFGPLWNHLSREDKFRTSGPGESNVRERCPEYRPDPLLFHHQKI